MSDPTPDPNPPIPEEPSPPTVFPTTHLPDAEQIRARVQQNLIDATEATSTTALPVPVPPPQDDAMMATCAADVTEARPALPGAPAASGATFGRYQIVGEIAHGSMGIVYKAFDPQLRRLVALKVMLGAERATVESTRRFEKEARMAAKVRHPNIVQVYDVGEFEGKLFYTMELIEGESLQGIIRKMGRLPTRLALKIARDAARALHAAHQQNLIHRDIKPANLLITPRERFRGETVAADETALQIGEIRTTSFRVLLSDFGIAKDVTSQTLMTKAGTVVGTPAYMSPEQAGEPELMGPVSDVYSLAVVLYHMLCGQTPFADPDVVRLLEQVISREPPPLRKFAPDVHPDLETIVAKAMMKEPARRYESAEAFADDLDRYLTGERIQARRASAGYRAWRWCVRNRVAVLPAVAAGFVGLAMLAAFVAWPRIRAYRDSQHAAQERAFRSADARARIERAEALLRDGKNAPAVEEAETLISTYGPFGKDGESVSLPEAHDLLARVHDREHAPKLALLERARAYRSAIGVAGGERFVLRTARELVAQVRHDEALALLSRVLRQPLDPATAAEAHYWMGRALEGIFDPARAMYELHAARSSPALPAELRVECAEHEKFCASLARTVPFPKILDGLAWIDLAHDGRKEFVKLDHGDLVIGERQKEEPVERFRVGVPTDRGFRPGHLAFVDVREWKSTAILVRGQFDELKSEGFRLYRWDGHAAAEVAAGTIDHGWCAPAAADVDGDGKPEFLFGTPTYDRALRVYDLDEAKHTLTQRVRVPIGGDVRRVEVVDLDGDGRREILVFAAEWGAYGVFVLRWDATRGEFVTVSRTTLGMPDSILRLDRDPAPPRWLVGVNWEKKMIFPLRHLLGDEEFEKKYRAVGVYLLTPEKDGTLACAPVAARDWRGAPRGGASGMMLLNGAAGKTVWCNLIYPAEVDGVATEGLATACHVFRMDGEALRPFASITPRPGSGVTVTGWLGPVDVDDDGVEELAVQTDRGRLCLAPWDKPLETPHAVDVGAGGSPAVAEKSPMLEFAADAEMLGLTEEALSAFQEAFDGARGLAEAEEAVRGRLRCLAALGQWAGLAAVARVDAGRFPALEVVILREAVRLLDDGCRWTDVEPLAARLLQAVRLGAEERKDLARRLETFRALAAREVRATLIGPNAADADWLATSPLMAARGADGTWTVYGSSEAADRLSAPIGGPRDSYVFRGELRPVRHEWAVGVHFGIGASAALDGGFTSSLWLDASGDTGMPLYNLNVDSAVDGRWLVERTEPWPSALAFDLDFVKHQQKIHARIGGLGKAEVTCALEAAAPRTDPVYFGVQFHGHGPGGFWAVFRIARLELLGVPESWKPAAFRPECATDCLLLANGRWIVGKLDEAAQAYDQAVQLGDLERAQDQAAVAAKLPSSWARGSLGDIVRWTALDARFFRGLLRAARDDVAGARADLAAAWEMSEERLASLLRRNALPLEDRPKETAALRALLAEHGGRATGAERIAWIRKSIESLGPTVAALFIEGVHIDRIPCLGIRAVGADSPGKAAGLRAGDIIRAVDGRALASLAELKAALQAAAGAGRKEVSFDLQRAGMPAHLSVPSGELGIEIEPIEVQELRVDDPR